MLHNASFNKHSHHQPKKSSLNTLNQQTLQSQQPESPQPNQNKAFGQIFSYFIKRNDAKSLFFNLQSKNLMGDPVEKDFIKEQLESVKSQGMLFENMPQISYDDREKGWKQIYLGILSPYSNKYHHYIEAAIQKAKEEHEQLRQSRKNSQMDAEANMPKGFKKSRTKIKFPQAVMKNEENQQKFKGTTFEEMKQYKDGKLNAMNLKRNLSLKKVDPLVPKSSEEEQLMKLSDFKKQLILNELISGKISRNSAQYVSQFFRTSQNDYMASLLKKIMIKKTMKRNFDEPESLGVKVQKKQELGRSVSTGKLPLYNSKTVESLNLIRQKLSRVGLDGTLPHFQLDVNKFSFMDFDKCLSPALADLMNAKHKIAIKREKHRNCKSMVAIPAKNARGKQKSYDYSSDEEGEPTDQKMQEFLDAHYLNRRKSCVCHCCGGDDSQPIRRMDKRAMDMLQVELTSILRQKIIGAQNFGLRRQKLERWDQNDKLIAKPKRLHSPLNMKLQRKIQGQLGQRLSHTTTIRIPGAARHSIAIMDNFRNLRMSTKKPKEEVKKDTIILSMDELRKFSNDNDQQLIEESNESSDQSSSNSSSNSKESSSEVQSSSIESPNTLPQPHSAAIIGQKKYLQHKTLESSVDSLGTSIFSSELDLQESEKLDKKNSCKTVESPHKSLKDLHRMQTNKSGHLNKLYRCRDSLKIRAFSLLSQDKTQDVANYLSSPVITKQNQALNNQEQVAELISKFKSKIKKFEIQSCIPQQRLVKTSHTFKRHQSVQLLRPNEQPLSKSKKSTPAFISKYVTSECTTAADLPRVWTTSHIGHNLISTKSNHDLDSIFEKPRTSDKDFFKQRVKTQLNKKRSSIANYLTELKAHHNQTSSLLKNDFLNRVASAKVQL